MPDGHASTNDPAIGGVFRQPFTEQVAFFRRKLGNLVPTERWDDMLGAAHDDGFMVAGAAKADLLTDLAAATDKAIAEGIGLEAFRSDFRAIVAKHGWTGWTGEGSVRGEAWRVKTIYRTNMMTSYAAGRMAQLRAEDWPLWIYRHGGSLEPRLHHLSWDGIALPPDHPFWATHYPPSDWGCSCYVLGARSARGVKRLGGDPDKQLPANWQRIDRRTGAPIGIGKGWNYAPGGSVSETVQALAWKLGKWDHQIAKGFMDQLDPSRADALAEAYRALPSTADDVRRYAQRVYQPKADLPELPPVQSMGRLRTDQSQRIRELLNRDVDGYDFMIDADTVQHVLDRHGPGNERDSRQRPVEAAAWSQLPQLISQAGEMRHVGKNDQGQEVVELHAVIGDDTFVTRWAVLGQKRRSLQLKSFFIKKGK